MSEPLLFYCGLTHYKWDRHEVAPGPLACVAPVYGKTVRTKKINRVFVPEGTQVIQDSGAFSDGPEQRLTFDAAFARQMDHMCEYEYADKVTHVASYDLLVDEVWVGSNRFKRRWSESAADEAVDITVNAARYLKGRYDKPCILSAQGVTASQYFECVKRIVTMLGPDDILGLGGWCIVGKLSTVILPTFKETLDLVVPYAAQAGVKRIHIWGVLFAPALAELLYRADQYDITISTDSVGPVVRPAFGVWGYDDWFDPYYKRVPPAIRGLERTRHVQATRNWLTRFRDTANYRAVAIGSTQMRMF